MAQTSRDLRNENRLRIYEYVQKESVTNRAEISRATGISAPTVQRIIDEFLENGIMLETEFPGSVLGRRPIGIRLNAGFACIAAVQWEGRWIQASLLDMRGGVIASRQQSYENDFEALIRRQVPRLIDDMLSERDIPREKLAGIGIGLPAILDPYEKIVFEAPLVGITRQVDISGWLREIEEQYGAFVVIENDVNLQALGEHTVRGIGTDADMAYVSIGTGLGSGLMLRGDLRRGKNNRAGEIGYLRTWCQGKWPPLESVVGSAGLEKQIGCRLDEDMPPEKREAAVAHLVECLAPVLVNFSIAVDLDLIVVGGTTTRLLGDGLVDRLRERVAGLAKLPLVIEAGVSPMPGREGIRYLVDKRFRQGLLREGIEMMRSLACG